MYEVGLWIYAERGVWHGLFTRKMLSGIHPPHAGPAGCGPGPWAGGGRGWSAAHPGVAWIYGCWAGSGLVGGLSRRGLDLRVLGGSGLIGGLSRRGLDLRTSLGGSGLVGGPSRRGLGSTGAGPVGVGRRPIQAWPGSTDVAGRVGLVGGLSRRGLDLRTWPRGQGWPWPAWPASTSAHPPKPTAEAAISGSATPCVAGQTMTKTERGRPDNDEDRCVAGRQCQLGRWPSQAWLGSTNSPPTEADRRSRHLR